MTGEFCEPTHIIFFDKKYQKHSVLNKKKMVIPYENLLKL